MAISKKKMQAVLTAIDEPIMRARIEIQKQKELKAYNIQDKIDDLLFLLSCKISSDVEKILNDNEKQKG